MNAIMRLASRVILEILQWIIKWKIGGRRGEVGDSSCFLHLGHRIFSVLPILYITGFKGRKMDKCIPDNIMTFDKPISQNFSPNIKTENMVSSHQLSLTMKYIFKKFVVKFLCYKVFGKLLPS